MTSATSSSATGPRSAPNCKARFTCILALPDTYFLNDAVDYLKDFLKNAKNPPYGGEVKYGDRAEHCWNGDPVLPNYFSRLHYHMMYVPKMLQRLEKTAPRGADLKSRRY